MNKIKTTITFIVNVDDRDIEDIMDIVLWDGIDYWCDEVRLKCDSIEGLTIPERFVRKGGAIGIHEEDEGWHILTKKDILFGIKKCIEKQFETMLDYGAIIANGGEVLIDIGGVDSTIADWIIQYAIFGDLIYG